MTDLFIILSSDLRARLPAPWLTRPPHEPEQWISEYPKPALCSWKLQGTTLTLTDRRNPTQPAWDPEYHWHYKEWTYDLADPSSLTHFEQQLREIGVPLGEGVGERDAKLESGDSCSWG